jgi:hypothetical protein
LAEIFRTHGYALAVHGSVGTDFDLIAVPWVEQAGEPMDVIAECLAKFAFEKLTEQDKPAPKPHSRCAYKLHLSFGDCALDISFTPRTGNYWSPKRKVRVHDEQADGPIGSPPKAPSPESPLLASDLPKGWVCTVCARTNSDAETHCAQCEWSRRWMIAGVLHERSCGGNPCRCDATPGTADRIHHRGEVMNPPASAAEGAEAGNLNTPQRHGSGADPRAPEARPADGAPPPAITPRERGCP